MSGPVFTIVASVSNEFHGLVAFLCLPPGDVVVRLALVDSWRSVALLIPHTILASKTNSTHLMVSMPEDCYQNISLIAIL